MPIPVLLCRIDGNFGGVERHILNLAQHMDRNRFFPVIVPISNHGELERNARKLDVQTEFLPMRNRFSIGSAQTTLKQIIQKHQAGIVHTFGLRSSTLACKVSRELTIPWIVRLPNINATDYANPLRGFLSHWLNNHLIRRADALQVISPQLEGYVKQWRNPPQRVFMIPNGIDSTFYGKQPSKKCRQSLGIPENSIVIGSVGRLEPIKGYDLLLYAMSKIKRDIPASQLLIIGEGKDRHGLEQSAVQLGLQDALHLPGYVADVREALSAIDIFVCSSRSEGVPNAVLEAMATSRPIIATRVGGMESILENEKEGIVIPPDDRQALENALRDLLNHEGKRNKLGQNARNRVENEFSIESMVGNVQAMYEFVLKEKKAGSQQPGG